MGARHFIAGPAVVAVMMLGSACSSRDERASAAAELANAAFQQGQLFVAKQQIAQALALRDDVSDYWQLSAQIALAEQDYGGAFQAYEGVVMLDHTNIEALNRLCQIALGADQPDRATRYADQLALLSPGNKSAITIKAAVALKQGDKQTAARLLDQVLATDATDPAALLVKSKLLSANEDYAGAAQAAEAALNGPGDPGGRLDVLKGIYRKSKDAAGYSRTVARIARAYQDAAAAQLDYATDLYAHGDAAGALAVTRRLLGKSAADVATTHRVLNLWVAQGAAAMPLGAIAANAADAPLPVKATYAQYANAIGHPEIALAVLGRIAEQDPANPTNADAKAARAYARAQTGAADAARAEIAAVLAADNDQPVALIARAALRAKANDRRGAIEDLRHALAGDPDNASARMTLADLQIAEGEGVLAVTTLQDGLNGPGGDPRLVARLAAVLRAQGRGAEASEVLAQYARDNPFAAPLRG